MYLACRTINGKPRYFIAQSYSKGKQLASRDLVDLGANPEVFIVYPGGNAYYIDEVISEKLADRGVDPDLDKLDDLFMPFVRPEIRRIIDPLRERSNAMKPAHRLTPDQVAELESQLHVFDKRRVHFLRFGQMEQGNIGRLPTSLLKRFYMKSRDEIEQDFLGMERSLKERELKAYVYVIFDLQRFFDRQYARTAPQLLDQEKVDGYLIQEICRLNLVLHPQQKRFGSVLHAYLHRYLFMFFDHDYAGFSLMEDYLRDFMNRHRAHFQPAAGRSVSDEQAQSVFGVNKKELQSMGRRELIQRYRRLARQHHPDHGGSHEKFVELNEVFQSLIKRKV